MSAGLKKLLEELLNQGSYKEQFERRKQQYRYIEKYLPDKFEDIITDSEPWYHHGLGFRLATFPNEVVFKRLNSLLKSAEGLEGWKDESQNVVKTWASNFDQFFHHLWMLQCVEYYIDKGYEVSFPRKQGKKAPDLEITKNGKTSYVECYVYSKWWFTEVFIKEIIDLIDSNLCLERMYNLKPINTHKDMLEILNNIACILESSSLKKARTKVLTKSPYILYEKNGIKLLMKGGGEYQASDNAHGEPSAQVYINEIIDHKCTKNDLVSHRPNRLMVNGLGIDFQNIFSKDCSHLFFDCCNIDELRIHSCGIDEKLADCIRKLLIPRKE